MLPNKALVACPSKNPYTFDGQATMLKDPPAEKLRRQMTYLSVPTYTMPDESTRTAKAPATVANAVMSFVLVTIDLTLLLP